MSVFCLFVCVFWQCLYVNTEISKTNQSIKQIEDVRGENVNNPGGYGVGRFEQKVHGPDEKLFQCKGWKITL